MTHPTCVRADGDGVFLFDFDNDGDLDALNGNGMDDPETTDDDWAVNRNCMWITEKMKGLEW